MNDISTIFILNELSYRLSRWQEEIGYDDHLFDILDGAKHGSRNIELLEIALAQVTELFLEEMRKTEEN